MSCETASPTYPELLAPAGGPDAGTAALASGADAIYLGLKRFSARAEADNFGLEELDGITGYAHSLSPRRRVFAAVNTLVLDDEVAAAIEDLGSLADIGVDAVIVQDLGVARLVRQHFPRLALHASTQLAVHSRAGVEALRSLGFARATLARELTVEEIAQAASVEGIEVEAFVHGALCYAYSGLCLFSSQLGGRSGNRGACAYSCRDGWQVGTVIESGSPAAASDLPGGFAFSMKDLAAPDFVGALRDAGVASLKIEGRKKSPLYVAATVSYYRALLDGRLSEEERAAREQDIQAVFSRPWTSLFLGSRLDKDVADRDFVGHRGARVGEVEAVVRSGRQVFVRFRSARALERHDGLQIDIPGQGRPFGFPVDVLRLVSPGPGDRHGRSKEVPTASAGSLVEVALPDGYPTIPLGAPISCSSSQAVKERYRQARPNLAAHRSRAPLRVKARLTQSELAVEAAAEGPCGVASARASLTGAFEPAKDPSRTSAALKAAFEKLGDTRLALESFELEDPHGLFVPASRANELRRQLAGELEGKLRALHAERLRGIEAELAPPAKGEGKPVEGSLRWSLKVDRVGFLELLSAADLEGVEEVIVEIARDSGPKLLEGLEALSATVGRERVRLALPMIARSWEERGLRGKIDRLREAGYTRWQAANIAHWSYLGVEPGKPCELDLSADGSMYVMNRQAARQLRDMGATRLTLSVEDGLANLALLLRELGESASVIAFQDTPLFVSESCPYANLKGGCPGVSACRFESMELRSSHGGDVLAINDRCRSIVINAAPFCLAHRIEDLRRAGARRLRADFIHRAYSAALVRDLWRALRSGGNALNGHIANFDRGFAGARLP